MTTRKTAASDSPEVRERAVRLVLKGGGEHPTQLPPFGPSKAALPLRAHIGHLDGSSAFRKADVDLRLPMDREGWRADLWRGRLQRR